MRRNNIYEGLIYCAGPAAFSQDRWQLLDIDARLTAAGFRTYIPFRDGLDGLYPGAPDAEDQDPALARSILAFNLYRLIEACDALVYIINGRVPDEGGLIAAAVAFMTGIPVVLYKQDHRSVFHGFDNAMITGLSRTFSTVRRPEQICRAIAREIKKAARQKKTRSVPPAMAAAIAQGKALADGLYSGDTILNSLELSMVSPDNNRLVYCSGPLFCPGEVQVMAAMARRLEDAGWSTYLPHRDGVEAFVMKNTDSYPVNLARPLVRFGHRLVFAVDVYHILKCHCLVFNLNGRVPDEGGVAEIGLAFASGKPVILYREPGLSDRQAIDPMIIGVMSPARAAAAIDQIPGQAAAIPPDQYRTEDLTATAADLPPHLKSLVRLGARATRTMKRIGFLKPKNLF
jgi:nucleoside 2-deoxyribosyltransferase